MPRGNGFRQWAILDELQRHGGVLWLRNLDASAHRNLLPSLCRAVKGLERRGHLRIVKQAPTGWRRKLWLLDLLAR